MLHHTSMLIMHSNGIMFLQLVNTALIHQIPTILSNKNILIALNESWIFNIAVTLVWQHKVLKQFKRYFFHYIMQKNLGK